jgi:choline-glycine betaine transporter
MTALLTRVVIYTIVMFLILIVYTGQHHDNASDILRDSLRKTAKFVGWTAILIVVMELCFWVFIDD